MKYTSIIRNCILILVAAVLFGACKKTVAPIPMGDAGQTLVKFIDGGTPAAPGGKLINIELTDQPQTFFVADLRRLIPNNTELNKVMNVVIKSDAGAVSAYNSDLEAIPDGSFDIASENATIVGGEYHIALQPGQFAYNLNITLINSLALDLTKNYGAGFTIYTADADGVILDEAKSYVLEFGVKNEMDGIFRLYSSFSRADQPGFVGVNNSPAGYYQPYYLATSGGSSVDPSITIPAGLANTQIIYNSGTGAYTYFTAVAPRLTLDRSNNSITVTPGVPITPPATVFTQSATELAASKFYPTGITGVANSEGRATIVAHFRWSATGIDRIAKDTFVYLQPR